MKKPFTVGDMISVLQKLDVALPLYDSYNDENEGMCWFNLSKPKPKTKTLYLFRKKDENNLLLKLTDDKKEMPREEWELLSATKVAILYPMGKGEIEIG